MNTKHLPSIAIGAAAAVAFMFSCGETGSDTLADAGSGACGACTVQGPIALEQPVQVKTADTDASRLLGGALTPDEGGTKIFERDKPAVISDVLAAVSRVGRDASGSVVVPHEK